MVHRCSESDWRAFRDVRDATIERACARTLQEVVTIAAQSSRGSADRLRAIAAAAEEQFRRIDFTCSGAARSNMVIHLAAMHAAGMLESDDLAGFSADVRESVTTIAKARKP